jgi:GT2 family glycosyltransferase
MKSERVAVLLTCFNRRQKTLECLDSLFKQVFADDVSLHVYLVDDGSTDGTTEAVHRVYPQVNVLQGTGNLFWTGGMWLASREALKHQCDYHLWLNDDTNLYPDAVNQLLMTSYKLNEQGSKRAVVVGSIQDPHTKQFAYGGMKRNRFHPCQFGEIRPGDEPQRCETMSGNCVLISKEVIKCVGGLDRTFRHFAADFDYGLRATRNGCTVWVAPGYLGACSPDSPEEQKQKLQQMTLREQLQKLTQPKGLQLGGLTLQPFWEWKVFTQRHAGLFWFIFWLLPYRRLAWMGVSQLLK